MYITLETDYAVRIVDCLARNPGRMGAKAIAEKSCVTLRFSLKILRKLVACGIAKSYKGSQGGYELGRPMDQITLNDILEAIEGPYTLNRCQMNEQECSRVPDKRCPYHYLFMHISDKVRAELQSVTIASIVGMTTGFDGGNSIIKTLRTEGFLRLEGRDKETKHYMLRAG